MTAGPSCWRRRSTTSPGSGRRCATRRSSAIASCAGSAPAGAARSTLERSQRNARVLGVRLRLPSANVPAPSHILGRSCLRPAIDPRRGDIEDDASSSKRRSLLSLAGSLFAEISLPKLAVAFTLLVVVPALTLGVAPILAAIWFGKLSSKLATALTGVWPAILLLIVAVVGWFGGLPLFRLAENSFWSFNSLVVQPVYAVCREALRQLAERWLPVRATGIQRAKLRAAAAVVSGSMICAVALLVVAAVLPHADLLRGAAGVGSPSHLAAVALANTVMLVAGYLAAAALIWGIADATM